MSTLSTSLPRARRARARSASSGVVGLRSRSRRAGRDPAAGHAGAAHAAAVRRRARRPAARARSPARRMVLYLAAGAARAAGVRADGRAGRRALLRSDRRLPHRVSARPPLSRAGSARRAPSLFGRWLAAMAGIRGHLLGGVAQLTIITGSLATAVVIGLLPSPPLDVVKALVAAHAVTRSLSRGRRTG